MSIRLNKTELELKIKESIEKLQTIPTSSKEHRNLQNNIYRLKKKLEERKDEPDEIRYTNKKEKKSKSEMDEIIAKEVWMNTTHKIEKEDYNKYKYKVLLDEEFYRCSKCGKLTNEKYYLDLFDLQKGFVCDECNKKYFNNKASKILI